MKKIILGLSTLLLLLFTSCEKNSTGGNEAESYIINNDQGSLNTQVEVHNADNYLFSKEFLSELEEESSTSLEFNGYNMVLIADVEQPIIQNDQTVDATQVSIQGNKAYVSYNVAGDTYAGAIEVFDISNPFAPVMESQALFSHTDVNAICTDNETYVEDGITKRKLYLAASTDMDINDKNSPAIVKEIILEDGLLSDSVKTVDIPSYSANSIVKGSNWIMATAGSTGGGAFRLDLSKENYLGLVGSELLDNAKYVAINGREVGNNLVVLQSGVNATLNVFTITTSGVELQYKINIGEISPSNGKSVLHLVGNLAYVAMGSNGLAVYDITSTSTEPVYTFSASNLSNGNVNGVTTDDNFIYLACGSDGLIVASIPESGTELKKYGTWNFDGSANFVETNGECIFLANGSGGLKILKVIPYNPADGGYIPNSGWDSDGMPDILADTPLTIEYNYTQMIQDSLRAHKNDTYVNTPETIKVIKDGELFLAFLYEGASFRNSFGYYVFDTSNPPQSLNDVNNKTIVFPNASFDGSGGKLQTGDYVSLGNFTAGQSIGFVNVSNGWDKKNKIVTEGLWELNSKNSFNTQIDDDNLKQHMITLYDQTNDRIIICAEDIKRDQNSCDHDFDDVVTTIFSEEAGSFEVTNIPVIE